MPDEYDRCTGRRVRESLKGPGLAGEARAPAGSFRVSSGCLCSRGIREEAAGGSDRAGGRRRASQVSEVVGAETAQLVEEMRQAGAMTTGIPGAVPPF